MTVDPARLLQMLEPAVRPGAAPSSAGAQAGKPAFENSTFQQLLADAGQSGEAAEEQAETSQQGARALDALGGLGRIENATLRRVLEQGGDADSGTGSNG